MTKVILPDELDAILKDIDNNGRTTKPISVKRQDGNINLHPLLIKLLKAEFEFDKTFNIFNEIDNKRYKLRQYNSRTLTNLIKKWNARVFVNHRR